jgi:nucleotide-binding universal stress UspA family protein
MISTIVVGTDGSQTARRAMTVAAELARRFGARLHVVHAYLDPTSGPDGRRRPGATRWHEASEAVLEDALADAILDGVDTEGHAVAAPAHEAIVGVAVEIGADLIVVGNRGMSSSGGGTGSVPDNVARRAPCHVLIAKTT